MVKTLKRLCIESFFTCKKTKLYSSYYCLFSYIHLLMNKREISSSILCERNDLFLEKEALKEHFMRTNLEKKLEKQHIFLSSMKKRAFFKKKKYTEDCKSLPF